MTTWMVRAGQHGEYEAQFIEDKKLLLTWDGLCSNLAQVPSREALVDLLGQRYPQDSLGRRRNHASQLEPFAKVMQKGDWVVLPRKTDRTICIGKITGDYVFDATASDPFYHSRAVEWLVEGLPREHFGQDLLHSFGAFMTVCKIERNGADARIRAMAANNWKPETLAAQAAGSAELADDTRVVAGALNLSEAGQDQIASVVMARFAGHDLARLVAAILQAQGYHTSVSTPGPDGGVDILAGSGALGFAEPRLCVQVKSHVQKTADLAEFTKLEDTMKTFGSTHGLFVSWAGYASNVTAAARKRFFSIRLWSQTDLFAALFDVYDKLPSDIRAELPLTRVWTVEHTDS